MNLPRQFEEFIRTEQLFRKSDGLLIAVSGGVDSMVLCQLCRETGFNFAIAHCNFQLRSTESDADEQFVAGFARQLKVPFFNTRFDTPAFASAHGLSIQEAARQLRYNWFHELINHPDQMGTYQYILTAHHADDNAETILMNFFKGSGINGLKGIMPKKEKVVRPLLFARKKDLMEYAAANSLTFREDSSNLSDKYTRNYFRNRVIPLLEELVPGVSAKLIDQAEKFRDLKVIYDDYIQKVRESLLESRNNAFYIPVLKLRKQKALQTVIYELAAGFNFSALQVDGIEKLLDAESGKYITSSTHRVLKDRKWLIITELDQKENEIILIEKGDSHIEFAGQTLAIRELESTGNINPDSSIANLDSAVIQFPLILRRWRQGDYFYPLGMKKKKKLSRFFIDNKLSLLEKENVWVLESNRKILWVIGHRIDDRFKIKTGTQKILHFQLMAKK